MKQAELLKCCIDARMNLCGHAFNGFSITLPNNRDVDFNSIVENLGDLIYGTISQDRKFSITNNAESGTNSFMTQHTPDRGTRKMDCVWMFFPDSFVILNTTRFKLQAVHEKPKILSIDGILGSETEHNGHIFFVQHSGSIQGFFYLSKFLLKHRGVDEMHFYPIPDLSVDIFKRLLDGIMTFLMPAKVKNVRVHAIVAELRETETAVDLSSPARGRAPAVLWCEGGGSRRGPAQRGAAGPQPRAERRRPWSTRAA